MFVYVIMPSFQDTGALKALYDSLAGTVNFTLLLKDAGKINVATQSISLVVRVGDEFVEAEVSAGELQALITADDQAAIVYKLKVSAIPPVVLIYYAFEQSSTGVDTRVSMNPGNSTGTISLYGKPGPLSKPEVITKNITPSDDQSTNVDVSVPLRLALPDNNGGSDLSTYNLAITVDDVPDLSVINQAISSEDIKNKYFLYTLNKNNISEGKKIVIAYNVDNKAGVQSKYSPSLVIVASFKPAQPSFTAESGKRDNEYMYMPLKINADISLPNWSKLHILRKKVDGDYYADGDWIVAKTLNRDGSSTTLTGSNGFAATNLTNKSIDEEINAKGFYEYNLYRSRDSPSEGLKAFKKYEFAVVVSNGDYSSSEPVTQSKRSESRIAVTGTKKFDPTATTTSILCPQSSSTSNGQVTVIPAFHRFTHSVSGFTAPIELVIIANLLQNGVTVDTKSVIIAKDATTSGNVVFDRLASLVKSSDKFKIAFQVKASISSDNLKYIPQETLLHGRPAVLMGSSSGDEIVSQPLPTDFDTALKFSGVDDVINSADRSHRRLLVSLEMLQHSDDAPYKITSYNYQVSTDPSFAPDKLVDISLSNGTTGTETVTDFSKKIKEAILIKSLIRIAQVGYGASADYAPQRGTAASANYAPQRGTAASADYRAAGGEDLDSVQSASEQQAISQGNNIHMALLAGTTARALAAQRNDAISNSGGYVGPKVGTAASADYRAQVGTAASADYRAQVGTANSTDFAPATTVEGTFLKETKYWLRVATNHTYIGGGANVVQRPWVVYEYKTEAEDSVPAPADLTAVQNDTKTLKVTYAKAESIVWDELRADGFPYLEPKTYQFRLLNEIGQVLQTKTIPHLESSLSLLSFNFDLQDSILDQYCRVTQTVNYGNINGVSFNSDENPGVEVWLAARLVIKSVQIVESAGKFKMIVEIYQGRSDPSTTQAQAVIPYVSNTVDSFIANLSYDSTLKKFVTVELVKQSDPQLIKYGAAAKYFIFATGANGQMVSTVYPM